MLVYDQPIGEPRSGASEAPPQRFAALNLQDLGLLLWRRKTAIAAAGLICACAAVMIGKSLTPKYSATAQLYVDPRELQLVDRELTPRSQDISGLAMVVDSQARVITSNSVLLKVIQDTNLDKDPEFGGASKGTVAKLLGLFGFEIHSAGQAKLDQMTALEALSRHISVKKPDRTFIVDIDVWSSDPAKAAMLANAISNAYLGESRSSQATAARRATTDLSGRLKELQQRLRNAENALTVYKTQNNFVGSQDTVISDQQLSASNQRLAAARAQTLDAQAKYDQIEASRRASTDVGAIPEALQSPTIANLRAQYAEARKRYAEMTSELGPLHPALHQMEKQVEDLRRTINEEVDRFAQAAKNDLTRARDYEASLNKALDAQKRQSVQLSQASVRLRELEREVDASRDLYQSFLKRSRETEEQESLNTSSARIIGEATVPQRRIFPPAMSLLAMVGFVLGSLAAAGWAVAADRLSPDTTEPEPVSSETGPLAALATQPPSPSREPQSPIVSIERPVIARLQESDVMRTLGGILAGGRIPDLTRIGWPTLRAGFPLTSFLNAMREMRAPLIRRSPADTIPVMAVIGADAAAGRSIAALNIALAAARDGAKVLMIDADHVTHALSDKLDRVGQSEVSRFNRLGLGNMASHAIETANGISILPAVKGSDAVRTAIAQSYSAGGYDLVVLDGPAMPWSPADRKLLDAANGLVAVLPANLDINDCMEDIIAALGGAERKLIGVVLNELPPAVVNRQRDRQYA
ncbi:GumC family protein [Bradyrhizobium canariense]|uniref:Uncharacterized protein involved in exopolysaccharide biosynthesis n=1 Tax=Bradyrhizobium canariense TaxID=255045 RepID=A0A1H1WDR1_9BRAD|nr:exopolysaccharide transport family protein [Bradyrhizobium canariense]SDS94269.1 Uncharacterized protein involved in exopolysaccharide biosynthesis [Bradyrhizobium canariense]